MIKVITVAIEEIYDILPLVPEVVNRIINLQNPNVRTLLSV